MDIKAIGKALAAKAVKHSPAILTALGIGGFATTCVMVAKASPTASDVHARAAWAREDAKAEPNADALIKDSYFEEGVELAKLYGPAAAVGVASVGCFVAANKINLDRQAAVIAAYSLSTDTLAKYQDKVIEKFGEEAHADILNEATKEIADKHPQENYDYSTDVIPAGTVRVFDTVTGRYFYCSRERILEAESDVNKRLVNEMRVPLQEFYYSLGLEERFGLGEVLGWDISRQYGEGLNVMMCPHLDDEKNPCLAINYHVDVLVQRGA